MQPAPKALSFAPHRDAGPPDRRGAGRHFHVGEAYRILLSRLTGAPDRHFHVGDAGIVHYKLKVHVDELIRVALSSF